MPVNFSYTGEAITDELIEFNTTETISGTTYYVGFLSNWSDGAIADANQTNYGLWTATSKGGTQKTVLLSGYPADASEIAVRIDLGMKVYATASTSLYACYIGHGEIEFIPKIRLDYSGVLSNGVTADYCIQPIPRNFTATYYSFWFDEAPSSAVTISLELRDAEGGTGNSRTLTLTSISSSNKRNKLTALSSAMSFDTSKVCVLRCDGKNCVGLHVNLY